MRVLKENVEQSIRSIKFLQQLDEQTLNEIIEHAYICHYEAGEQIFTQGSVGDRVFIVRSGLVKHYISSPKGQEVFLYLGFPATKLIGISIALRQENYIYTLETILESEIITIPGSLINKLRNTSEELDQLLLDNISKYMLDVSVMLEHLVNFTSIERLACFFLRHVSQDNTKKVNVIIPFKKQHIATLLGIKFETFSRSLKKLEQYGIVVMSKQVEIKNVNKTRQLICDNCSQLYMNKEVEKCPLYVENHFISTF